MLDKDDRPAVEVGVLVQRPFTGDEQVIPSRLLGGTTAMTVHNGDYGGLSGAHQAVHAFAAAERLELAGRDGRSMAIGETIPGSLRPRSTTC